MGINHSLAAVKAATRYLGENAATRHLQRYETLLAHMPLRAVISGVEAHRRGLNMSDG